MRVIIAGSRNIKPSEYVDALNQFFDFNPTLIISGGARGVDTYAEQTSEFLEVPFQKFPADWDRYGKGAGHIRNLEMAKNADALFAVWDGSSEGTANMIDNARKLGLVYTVVVVRRGKVYKL